jgi:hypothetical protein
MMRGIATELVTTWIFGPQLTNWNLLGHDGDRLTLLHGIGDNKPDRLSFAGIPRDPMNQVRLPQVVTVYLRNR